MSKLTLMERIAKLESQVEIYNSRLESERGTRARANAEFARNNAGLDERLRSVEQKIWAIGGGLAVLNIILKLL